MKTSMIWTTIFSILLVSPVLADITKTVTPDTPEQVKAVQQSGGLVDQGNALMSAGNPIAAEKAFREALALEGWNAAADPGLAESLAAQGKTDEALRVYRSLIYQYPRNLSSVAHERRTQMHYAILLSQTGQWEEAVSIYEKNLPSAVYGDAPKLDVHFDPRIPMPFQLQAMAHIASGMEYTGHGQMEEAFGEYEQATHLAPDSAFANYYYGYGWQNLAPKDRAKLLNQEQAKAAFLKAVQLGKGDLKKAAQKSLKGFRPA